MPCILNGHERVRAETKLKTTTSSPEKILTKTEKKENAIAFQKQSREELRTDPVSMDKENQGPGGSSAEESDSSDEERLDVKQSRMRKTGARAKKTRGSDGKSLDNQTNGFDKQSGELKAAYQHQGKMRCCKRRRRNAASTCMFQ